MTPIDVVVRPAKASDLSYVYDTWLKCYRPSEPEMRDGDFYAWQRQRIATLLSSPGVALLVAHEPPSPDVIAGWCCRLADCIHFVYVRPEFRGKHVAALLIDGAEVCTHLTPDGARIKRKREIRYIPHLLEASL